MQCVEGRGRVSKRPSTSTQPPAPSVEEKGKTPAEAEDGKAKQGDEKETSKVKGKSGKLRRLKAFEGEVKDKSPKSQNQSAAGSSSVPEAAPKAKSQPKKKKKEEDDDPAARPKAKAKAVGVPKPKAKAKSGLVLTETHNGWTVQKFKRSTSGIPFWKFTDPTGHNYWTAWEAELNGFKRV